MKPVASTMTEVDNLPGDEIKFSISTANSAWVMRSMADLYSNRELACVREYSTNAYDSNKEKALRDGHAVRPIEVSLPNAMNPYFSVRDFGVGMSRNELTEVYTQFGESTKRDSDEYNGMLGFGSKSAIAYTNTFTVTSIKNGKKNVAVVTRREDAMGGYLVTLKVIIDDVPTSEESGVTVQIPVHNWREFEQKANDFYRFWLPGTVLVNTKEPKWAVGEKIDNDLYYYPNSNGGQNLSYVVMGNVPYRIINAEALFPRGMNRINFVAYVPLGTVEFTPSREDLKYSEHTKNNLRKIITDFVAKSIDTAKTEIASATTHAQAYKSWIKWRTVIGTGQVDDLTFKGDKLVDEFDLIGDRYELYAYRGGTWGIKKWRVADMDKTYIITNFDINLSAAHKKKVKDWLNATNRSATYAIFTADKTVASPWIDPDSVVSWEKVKAEAPKAPKKPRQQNVAWGRKAGSFDLITRTGRNREQDVPQVTDLYYIMVKDYNIQQDLANVLDEFNYDHEVVLVPANRKDKFLRFYPNAKEILPELRAKVVLDGMSLINADGQLYLQTNHEERYLLGALDANKVDDPKIKVLVNIFKENENHYLGEYKKNFRLANVLGMGNKFKRHKWESYWDSKLMPLTSEYPLASSFDYHNRSTTNKRINQHVYLYLNAVYQARKDGKQV